jgi:hypothetical protein
VTTVFKLLGDWRHRFAHALGVTEVTRHHGTVSGVDDAGVAYSWDECCECGALLDGLAHDREADKWYIPGPRELRHNVQLIRELEDP